MCYFKLISLTVILFFICCTVKQVQGATRIYKTVNTTLGPIRGRQFNTSTGNPVYIFRRVPYAEPPVGERRFKPPVPLSPWNETRDALSYADKCVQRRGSGVIEGNEDCLYLNIFSPELPSNTSNPNRPVLVLIHGGCFVTGYAQSNSQDYYVDNGILVVTIQYRLGALGFMSTGDSVLPGNLGMKDQVLALEWTKQNIAAFGGNPDDVTIGGQSAGGASVHYHVLSPKSKGLFKRAIAQSGSALSPWAFDKNATDRTYRFVSYLGYDAQNSSDLMQFLMMVNASELVKASLPALSDEDHTSTFVCVWVPHVEPESEDAFLTEEPWVITSENRYNHVPYLTGATNYELLIRTQEGGLFATEEGVKDLNDNFDDYIAHELRLSSKEEQLKASAQIRQFFFGDSEITLESNDSIATLVSDLMFVEGVHTVVQNMSKDSAYPVYYYEFSFYGPLSEFPDFPGACHGDDRRYMSNYASLESDSAGYRTGIRLLQMWSNFVKYSNPTPYTDELLTEEWNIFEINNTNYLEIASDLQAGTGLNKERMNFWHSVLP
ncbi:esterase FE4-like [Schistocerca americana]|uniref:esterase FE4-like n=1 Tax=Schistocerca americana TaxID=7009 RepID=UPI001F4FB116|nr:esterase FE4-like [Schistocerca americana]